MQIVSSGNVISCFLLGKYKKTKQKNTNLSSAELAQRKEQGNLPIFLTAAYIGRYREPDSDRHTDYQVISEQYDTKNKTSRTGRFGSHTYVIIIIITTTTINSIIIIIITIIIIFITIIINTFIIITIIITFFYYFYYYYYYYFYSVHTDIQTTKASLNNTAPRIKQVKQDALSVIPTLLSLFIVVVV